ncbi:MAG TPA: SRPBCC domain-containing protein [Candidatus Acidoferrales bacterium]|nr:SRPBCC domain-containing protein [Candidatus Acidoferrales bacterium]
MSITFGGEFRVHRKRDEVYHFLIDPDRFAPLLPDFERLTVADEGHSTVHVKVGIAHIRGTARVHLQLVEAEAPRRALYQGKGSVPGGSVNFTAAFDLEDDGAGTLVTWKGEAQLFGGIISVAGGLLEPLAKKNVQKLIAGLQEALA